MATLLYRLGLGAARRPLLVILAWVLALALAVGGGDRAHQVLVPVARAHHPHRDRHADQVDRLTTASV